MNNSTLALKSHNAAIKQISGGTTRPIVSGEDIRTTAARKTRSIDNSRQVQDQIEQESQAVQQPFLWYAFSISLGLIVLLILALKFKLIKI